MTESTKIPTITAETIVVAFEFMHSPSTIGRAMNALLHAIGHHYGTKTIGETMTKLASVTVGELMAATKQIGSTAYTDNAAEGAAKIACAFLIACAISIDEAKKLDLKLEDMPVMFPN